MIAEDIEEPQLSRVAPDIVPQLVQLLERWQDWASDEQLSGYVSSLSGMQRIAYALSCNPIVCAGLWPFFAT